jgi:hypothetical protein
MIPARHDESERAADLQKDDEDENNGRIAYREVVGDFRLKALVSFLPHRTIEL